MMARVDSSLFRVADVGGKEESGEDERIRTRDPRNFLAIPRTSASHARVLGRER